MCTDKFVFDKSITLDIFIPEHFSTTYVKFSTCLTIALYCIESQQRAVSGSKMHINEANTLTHE